MKEFLVGVGVALIVLLLSGIDSIVDIIFRRFGW